MRSRNRPSNLGRLGLSAALLAAAAATGAMADPGGGSLVLSRAVVRGDRLVDADLVEAPGEALAGGLARNEITGMEARRNLAAGSVVRGSDITRPQLVHRGEQVTVSLRRDGLVITSAGRALGSAALGETVRVVALATNRTVEAVVEGDAAVRLSTF